MPISRRNFLRTGSIAVVAAGAPVATINALAAEEAPAAKAARRQAGLMTKGAFAPHLNTTFVLKPDDQRPMQVKLIELHDIGPKAKATRRGRSAECFVLTFKGNEDYRLTQDSYEIEHPSLGRFNLLLVPLRNLKHGQVFEAVINHNRS